MKIYENFQKSIFLSALTIIVLNLFFRVAMVQAKEVSKVQEFTGRINLKENIFYNLPNLKVGQSLYVYAQGTSGNLDPFVAVLKPGIDISTLRQAFLANLDQATATGQDPLVAIPKILEKFFLLCDDDSGLGYDAALKFTIPADGDYQLIVRSNLARQTFGSYRLLIGLDAPEVLSGKAQPTEAQIAFMNNKDSLAGKGIREFKGKITVDRFYQFCDLNNIYAGETLFLYVKATSGDLKPVITLMDFGNKPIRNANYLAEESSSTLEHTFLHDGSNYTIKISGLHADGTISTGEYHMLVGINASEVLLGRAPEMGRGILKKPIPVKIGIRMQQITGVDQKSENFGVVASLMMRWQDPNLAFRPDICQCRFKIFEGEGVIRFANKKGVVWPSFTLFNQQGRRMTQNQVVVINPEGEALYYEHFSTTLQAPDFDFRLFPFDTQKFFIRVDSVFPERFFIYEYMEGFSDVGGKLGEEEWVVTNFDTEITTKTEGTGYPSSSFSFRFEANRHLNYYVFRIFLPILIIIFVSWFTFFIKDYSKRVDVTGANLLLFIAFNFTISNDLPRLGYITFIDFIIVSAFIVTSLVFIMAVYIKRLEGEGKQILAKRLDKYVLWLYPFAYVAAVIIAILIVSREI